MFHFEDIRCSGDDQELSGSCRMRPNSYFFKGHFEGQPLMPAAAQLQMLNAFLQSKNGWKEKIIGGKNLKFIERIIPNDLVSLHLVRCDGNTLQFTLHKNSALLASKGKLLLSGRHHG